MDDLICRAEIRDMDIENKCMDTKGGSVGLVGRLGLTYIYYRCKIDN